MFVDSLFNKLFSGSIISLMASHSNIYAVDNHFSVITELADLQVFADLRNLWSTFRSLVDHFIDHAIRKVISRQS